MLLSTLNAMLIVNAIQIHITAKLFRSDCITLYVSGSGSTYSLLVLEPGYLIDPVPCRTVLVKLTSSSR